jgi:hypothetical protein
VAPTSECPFLTVDTLSDSDVVVFNDNAVGQEKQDLVHKKLDPPTPTCRGRTSRSIS